MWRALVFIGLLCVAAFGAVWLADHPGTVAITWNGREYLTSLGAALIGILVLTMVLAAIWAFFGFLVEAPGRIGRGSRAKRRARGQNALSRGLVAIGSGDLATARRYAGEAERLVGHEPLTLLLRAQTAQAAGDRSGAEHAFRRMLDHPETRVLGLRGLFLEARRRDDRVAARIAATEAARLAPAIGWANDAILEGHSADGDWPAALRVVERRTSQGLADKTEARRQRAVLHAADAIAKDKAGQPDAALAAAQQALGLVPDLVPAAALAGRILSRQGDLKRAAKVVETAWRTNQHPDLAAAYLNLRPGDSATDRLRRGEALARLSSWSAESRLAIGRAAIEARELSRARETLRPLVEETPTVRVCLMMAELEQAEGGAGRVREWLARAARAPRDKAWIADGIVSDEWAPISPVTGRLDAFAWDTPPERLGRAPAEAGFLDALVSEPEPVAPAVEAAAPARIEPPSVPPIPDEPLPPPVPAKPEPSVPAAPPIVPPLPETPKKRMQPSPAALAPAPSVQPMPGDPALGTRLPDGSGPPLAPSPTAAPVRDVVVKDAAAKDTVAGDTRVKPTLPPRGGREPAPVVFPVAHPPDDPGPAASKEKRSRFGLGMGN